MPRLLIWNPTSLSKNTTKEVLRQNVFSYSYLGILFAIAKNAEIWGLNITRLSSYTQYQLQGLKKTRARLQVKDIKLRFFKNLILKVRTQCFLEKIQKKKWYSYSFWKDLSREYLVVPKFLMEVPKFKENDLICVNTVIKVCDPLFTLLQVITILAYISTHLLFWTYLLISNRRNKKQ